jgi:hypothetical protein
MRWRWLLGLLFACIFAVVLAIIMTAWNWLENPTGIFHGTAGTNWTFVWDTFESWLVPTLICSTLIIWGVLLAWWLRARLHQRPFREAHSSREAD